MKKINQKQKGFTLIELMIVVAIIGILAAVALPAYQTYTAKSKFSEVVLSTNALKSAVEVCYASTGSLADCKEGSGKDGVQAVEAAADGAIAGKYISTIDFGVTTADTITATAVGAAAAAVEGLKGETYTLKAEVSAGQLKWTKAGTCATAGYC